MSRAARDGVWARALPTLGLFALVVAGCGSGSSVGMGASARAGLRSQADPIARHPDLPPIPSEPAPVPPSLMAMVAVPNLAIFAAELAGYLNAVQPELLPSTSPWVLSGTIAALLGSKQVAGLTHEAPLWLLALRRPGDSESSWLAVLPVVDTAALAAALADDPVLRMQVHGGYAAIGTIEALRLGAGYALSSLIHTRPPGGLGTVTATVHMPALLRSFGLELSVMAAFYLTHATPGQSGPTLSELALALLRLAELADEVRAELAFTSSGDSDSSSSKRATLSLAIDGRAASTLALFAEAQSPASFAALDALPLGSVFLAAEGNLDATWPPTQPVDMSRWRWIYGDDVAARMKPLAEEWRRLRGGRVALTGDASPGIGVWVTMLLGVTDEARAGVLIEDWMRVLHGAKTTLVRVAFETVCTAEARRHRGVPIAQMTLALGAAVPETIRARFAAVFGSPGIDSYLAAGEGGLVWSLGRGARERLETVLDRVRRPRRSRDNTATDAAIQEAKARRESLLLGVDVAQLLGNLGLVPLPAEEGGLAVFGVGFAGRTISIRLTVPASAVRAAAHALGRR